MAKKEVIKTKIQTKKPKKDINKALVENFVSMQKALTNLAVKFDSLSDQISKLLQIFEISAKNFAEKAGGKGTESDREFLEKLNVLLDQNKTIAKGLTLMEEKLRERIHQPQPTQFQGYRPSMNRKFPRI